MQFLTHDDVILQRRLKEQDEIRLVQSLNRLFMTSDLGEKGQDLVCLLVDKMLRGSRPALHAALDAETALRVWDQAPSRCTFDGLFEIKERLGRYECDLHDCADLLRLFGAFAEGDGGLEAGVSAKRAPKPADDPLHGAFRKQQTVDPRKDPRKDLEERRTPTDRSASAESGKFRSRSEAGAVFPDYEYGAGLSHRHVVPHHLVRAFSAGPRPTLKSGCNRWALRMQSKSCQIDKVFWLPFGGDISGTTADSMFGLELATQLNEWADTEERKMFDFLVLMPLISLVELYNHTVLECALALMYCGIIEDYHIGYYTTLFPTKCGASQYAGVWEALDSYESGSPKLIVYTRQDLLRAGMTKVLRGFRMTGAEEKQFKPLTSVKRFYRDALKYPNNSAKAVLKLMGGTLGNEAVKAVHKHGKTHPRGIGTMMSEAEYLSHSFYSGAQDPFRLLWKRVQV